MNIQGWASVYRGRPSATLKGRLFIQFEKWSFSVSIKERERGAREEFREAASSSKALE